MYVFVCVRFYVGIRMVKYVFMTVCEIYEIYDVMYKVTSK